MSGLGLPIPAGIIPESDADDREYLEFTLPKKSVGKKFFDRFQESDLTFRVYELDPDAMERATKRAGGTENKLKLAREMTFLSIGQIGKWPTTGRYDDLKAWWKLIGFKGQMMAQKAVDELHTVEDDEIDMFLASRKASADE